MIVDLTKPAHREFPTAVEPNSEVLAQVTADWAKHDFPY